MKFMGWSLNVHIPPWPKCIRKARSSVVDCPKHLGLVDGVWVFGLFQKNSNGFKMRWLSLLRRLLPPLLHHSSTQPFVRTTASKAKAPGRQVHRIILSSLGVRNCRSIYHYHAKCVCTWVNGLLRNLRKRVAKCSGPKVGFTCFPTLPFSGTS